MSSKEYIINTSFMHYTLFETYQDKNIDLVKEIREAVLLESKYEEMGRRVLTENNSRADRNESHNDSRNLRI